MVWFLKVGFIYQILSSVPWHEIGNEFTYYKATQFHFYFKTNEKFRSIHTLYICYIRLYFVYAYKAECKSFPLCCRCRELCNSSPTIYRKVQASLSQESQEGFRWPLHSTELSSVEAPCRASMELSNACGKAIGDVDPRVCYCGNPLVFSAYWRELLL